MSEAVTYRTGSYYGDNETFHIWEITDAEGIAGELYVTTDRHEIANIEVRRDRRGEGLARLLYTTAIAAMDVYHAPEAHRTPEGNAFADAVGGDTVDPYDCNCDACTYTEE